MHLQESRWNGGHVGSRARVYFMNARFVAFDDYQSARIHGFPFGEKLIAIHDKGKLQHSSRIINRDMGNKLVNRIEAQANGSCFFFYFFPPSLSLSLSLCCRTVREKLSVV